MKIQEINKVISLGEVELGREDAFVYFDCISGKNLFLMKGREDVVIASLKKFLSRHQVFAKCVLKAINHVVAKDLETLRDNPDRDIVNYLDKKEVLTSDEAARYMGISKSYLYKLTMRQEIPYFRPMGKMCYFNRIELEQWLQRNRVPTNEEISQEAKRFCLNNKTRIRNN